MVRWPRVYVALVGLVARLPPRSRLRRAALRRGTLSGWSAFARDDLDLMLVRCTSDCVFELSPELVAVGLRSAYHGHAGAREQHADWREAFEQIHLTPLEILDAGDRAVTLGRVRARARRSGIEIDSPLAEVIWLERGLLARERRCLDWDAALREADIPTGSGG